MLNFCENMHALWTMACSMLNFKDKLQINQWLCMLFLFLNSKKGVNTAIIHIHCSHSGLVVHQKVEKSVVLARTLLDRNSLFHQTARLSLNHSRLKILVFIVVLNPYLTIKIISYRDFWCIRFPFHLLLAWKILFPIRDAWIGCNCNQEPNLPSISV